MEQEKERWRKIKDYDNYLISNFGRVYCQKHDIHYKFKNEDKTKTIKAKFLQTFVGNRGYLVVNINYKQLNVHRLVAIAFLKNPLNKKEINHIDGKKSNPYYKNLEWCTRSENIIHAYQNGLYKPIKGEKHCKTNLTNEQVEEIKNTPKKFGSGKILAKKFNITESSISYIRNGINWKHI